MKTLALCLMLIGTINLNAQNQELISEAQKEAAVINELLTMIDRVSPFYTPEEIKKIIDGYEKYSLSGDAWEIIDSCNNKAAVLLQQLITNEKYATIRTDTMVNTYKTASPDGNIIIHNWYCNNGGTFMMHYNLAEIKLPNGKKQYHELDYSGSIYESGFVPVANNNSYYFMGSTKGCSTCFDYTVMLFTLTDDGLMPLNILESLNNEPDFAFGIYFRGWDFDNNYISYNEIDHAFEYSHKNDDAGEDAVFYEEGRWIFNGSIFQQEVTMQLGREEFSNLFGNSDNN